MVNYLLKSCAKTHLLYFSGYSANYRYHPPREQEIYYWLNFFKSPMWYSRDSVSNQVSRYHSTNIWQCWFFTSFNKSPIHITELISAHLQRKIKHPADRSEVFLKALHIISIKDLIISLSGPLSLHNTARLVLLVVTFPTHMYSNNFARLLYSWVMYQWQDQQSTSYYMNTWCYIYGL